MLTEISWAEYFTGLALFLALYYLLVGTQYYYSDIKNFFAAKQDLELEAEGALHITPAGSEYPVAVTETHYPASETSGNDTMDQVEQLTTRLRGVIANASRKKYIKKEFIAFLRLALKEYPALADSKLRPSLNELITAECAKYGAVTLSEEDLELVWSDTV